MYLHITLHHLLSPYSCPTCQVYVARISDVRVVPPVASMRNGTRYICKVFLLYAILCGCATLKTGRKTSCNIYIEKVFRAYVFSYASGGCCESWNLYDILCILNVRCVLLRRIPLFDSPLCFLELEKIVNVIHNLVDKVCIKWQFSIILLKLMDIHHSR